MASDAIDTATLSQLQSKDHGHLLDLVDELHAQGVSKYIDLPQLIVCGDQSSGKSSVLEAISRVQFPTKNKLCTRFATELVMRRTRSSHVSVSIRPGPSRTKEEREFLSNFRPPFTSADDLPIIIEEAKEYMGCSEAGDAFSEDILCIESNGPDRPHLTIVDLPGLFHSESKQQSIQDGELVSKLVHQYMANPRSIILAIVAANYDFANQVVLKRARQVDPQGLRTLGIITKPDLLDPDSEGEQAWVSLAKNEDIFFRLGWHVLKNRNFQSREFSPQQRDTAESDFFADGVWRTLDQNTLGIDSLRERLNRVFLQHICSELPRVTKEITIGQEECRSALEKLGKARPGLDGQRNYLADIGQEFHTIASAAVNGFYFGPFFEMGHDEEDDLVRRFRATVHKLNTIFAGDMHLRGHFRHIVSSEKDFKEATNGNPITFSDFLREVQELSVLFRGREPPGMMNPLLVGQLFRKQAQPWKDIALSHIRNVFEHANEFIEMVLNDVACEEAKHRILDHHVEHLMEERLKMMEEKLHEILLPHTRDAPMNYDPQFHEHINRIKLSKAEHLQLKASQSAVAMDVAEVVDYMNTYYEYARRLFIDNVTALVIENCLIYHLPFLLTAKTPLSMSAEQVELLAGEPPELQRRRNDLEKKLDALSKGLRTCSKFAQRASSSSRPGPSSSAITTTLPTITRTRPVDNREGLTLVPGSARTGTPVNQPLPSDSSTTPSPQSHRSSNASPSRGPSRSANASPNTAATSPSLAADYKEGEYANEADW